MMNSRMTSRKTRRPLLRAALTTVVLVGALVVPTAAHADTPPEDEPSAVPTGEGPVDEDAPFLPSGSSLSSTPAEVPEGQVAPMATTVTYSPAKCVGTTDYPHSSNGRIRTTNGPYASVHGRTKCQWEADRVTARAEVWKKAWHGNTHLLTGTLAARNYDYVSGDSKPHYYCVGKGKAWYVGITNHSSYEGGKWYTARTIEYGTQSMSEFTC